MRTKEQIENKLNEMIEHMNKSARLSTSEKSLTTTLMNELKEEIQFQRDNALNDLEVLKTTELYSQIDIQSATIIRFRPRNSLPK